MHSNTLDSRLRLCGPSTRRRLHMSPQLLECVGAGAPHHGQHRWQPPRGNLPQHHDSLVRVLSITQRLVLRPWCRRSRASRPGYSSPFVESFASGSHSGCHADHKCSCSWCVRQALPSTTMCCLPWVLGR